MISLATLFVGPGTILLDFETPDRRGEVAIAWVLVGLGALYLLFAVVRIISGRQDGRWLRRLRDAVIGIALVACPLSVMNGLAPWKAVGAVWFLPVVALLFDRRHALSWVLTGREYSEPILRTSYLNIVLDPHIDTPDGEILRGRFTGRRLSELSPDQLDVLVSEASSDPDSVSILTGIVLQRRSADRRRSGSDGSGSARHRGGHYGAHGTGGTKRGAAMMDVEEALRVLGVAPGADKTEILTAHRRLMKRVHPDTGGSDYFASMLNEARDLLLGR